MFRNHLNLLLTRCYNKAVRVTLLYIIVPQIGLAQMSTPMFEQADNLLTQAEALKPNQKDSILYFLNKSSSLIRSGREELNPLLVRYHALLAQVYKAKKEVVQEIKHLDSAFSISIEHRLKGAGEFLRLKLALTPNANDTMVNREFKKLIRLYEHDGGPENDLAEIYRQYGRSLIMVKATQSAVPWLRRAIQKAKKYKDYVCVARSYHALGGIYFTARQDDSAQNYYELQLKFAKLAKDKEYEATAKLNLAASLINTYQSEKAAKLYFDIIEFFKTKDLHYEQAIVYTNLGMILHNLGRDSLAQNIVDSSLHQLEFLDASEYRMEYVTILLNAAEFYTRFGNLKKSDSINNRVLILARSLKLKVEESLAYLNLAHNFHKKNDTKRAFQYYQNGFRIADKYMLKIRLAGYKTVYGKMLLETGKYDEAQKACLEAEKLALSSSSNDFNTLVNCYTCLSDYYEHKGQYNLSLKYAKKSAECKDSIYSLETKKVVEKELARLKRDSRLKELNLQNELKDAQLLKTKLYVIGSILIGLMAVLYFIYRVREKDKLNRWEKEKNGQLADLVRRLELSNRDLSNFSNIVAHDIRNPLTTIKSYADILIHHREEVSTAEQKTYLNDISNTSQRLSNMLTQLLNLFDMDRSVERKKVDLNHVVAIAQKNISHHIKEKGGVIRHGQLLSVVGNESLLVQLFQNLLGNALKYSKEDVAPVVEILSKKIEKNEEAFIRIEIKDNGLGIPQDRHTEIFDYFKNFGDREDSYGIGLSVCKHIVEHMNGEILLESEPGKGTCFIVELPL